MKKSSRSGGSPGSAPIPSLRALPGAALRAVLREGYSRGHLKRDVGAGLVVGIVALPLSMALAINVGAPPQHGLYTAIIAGFVVALLGGSRTQVTGPTAAFIPILAPILLRYGLGGLLVTGMLAGIILIAMGALRLGRLIEFIPYPVTTGFTAGIATVIATLQLKDFFGLSLQGRPEHYWEILQGLWAGRESAKGVEFATGLVTLLLLLGIPRLTRKVPAPLIVLPLVSLAVALWEASHPGSPIATVADRFRTLIDGREVPGIPRIPPRFVLPWSLPGASGAPFSLDLALVRDLLPGALAVAMLGAIESLLSAVVADGMARTRHDPDAELLAAGVGNLLCPFFGGIPATGAIARTATNIRYGGRSPVASAIHALTVLGAVLAFAPLIGYLPMASLAALLLVVAWNMAEAKHFLRAVRVGPGSDRVVLLVCYFLTVVFDMVISVGVGVLLAALLFMRRMAELTGIQPEVPGEAGPAESPVEGVTVYTVAGPLFFGAAQKAMGVLGIVEGTTRVLVLRMDHVPMMDVTGLVAFENILADLSTRGCPVILVGCQGQPRRLIRDAGLRNRFPRIFIRKDLHGALAFAKSLAGPRIGPGAGRS